MRLLRLTRVPLEVASESPAERFLALDAMRGVAALAVLLIHIGFLSGARWLAPLGYLAVDLFFMISGFVIGWAFEPRLLSGMSRRRFMGLRLARLYPALFLGLLVGIAAYFVAPPPDYQIGWRSLGHFLLLPDLAGNGIFPLNGVFWTLFFELAINAVHAVVVRQLTTPRLAIFVFLSGLAWATAAVSLGDWGAGWNGRTFAAGFARVGWGYGAGLLVCRLMRAARRPVPRVPFIVPIGGATLLMLAPRVGWPIARNVASVFLLFPGLVLAAVAADVPAWGRAAARWLAAISYPLYAVHLPLLTIASTVTGGRLGRAEGPVALIACLSFATAAAYWYDMPLRSYLRARLPREGRSAREGPREAVYSAASAIAAPGAFVADAVHDLRRAGAIGWGLFRSELRARRRQSLLGHMWLFLPAAATAVVCAHLQRRGIVGVQKTPLPYPLFVASGVLLWQTFASAIAAPLQQLTAMRQLITRSRVPHEAVVAAGAAGALLDGAVRLLALLLILPLFGLAPGPSLLLLPLGFAALVLLGLAFGLILAPFGLLYEDVSRGLPFALLFWFFLSPVVYPAAGAPGWMRFNPVAPLIDASRSWLLTPSMPAGFVAVLAGSAVALAAAFLFYRVARPHLVARLA